MLFHTPLSFVTTGLGQPRLVSSITARVLSHLSALHAALADVCCFLSHLQTNVQHELLTPFTDAWR